MAIIQALGFMLGHGSGTIISRRLGSQDTHAATRFASTSFFTALAFGVVLAVVGLATLPDSAHRPEPEELTRLEDESSRALVQVCVKFINTRCIKPAI